MNSNRIMQQFHAIFGIFFVLFYIGTAVFLFFFSDMFSIDPALRMIVGVSFLLYGIYRAFKSYSDLKNLFKPREDDEEENF